MSVRVCVSGCNYDCGFVGVCVWGGGVSVGLGVIGNVCVYVCLLAERNGLGYKRVPRRNQDFEEIRHSQSHDSVNPACLVKEW